MIEPGSKEPIESGTMPESVAVALTLGILWIVGAACAFGLFVVGAL